MLQKTKTGQKAFSSAVCLEMNDRVDQNQKKGKKHDLRLSRNKSASFTALEKTECEGTEVEYNQNKIVKKKSNSPMICLNTFEPEFSNINTNYAPEETVSSVVNVNDGKNISEIIDISDSEKSYNHSKNLVASVGSAIPSKTGTLKIANSKKAKDTMRNENNNENVPTLENFKLKKKTAKRDSSVEKVICFYL